MSGIYIHIPFCRSKCSYCDFYSVVNNNLLSEFLPALFKEFELKRNFLKDKKIKTVYFGGGTPSVLKIEQINKITNELYKFYDLSELEEFSFEANPEDLSLKYLKELKNTPINRISIGVQSFYDEILLKLRRKHDVNSAVSAITNSQKAGFENICADLIYGISGLNNDMWKMTLNKIFNLPVKHLSAYHLSIEPDTILYKQVNQKKYNPVDDETGWEQFVLLSETAKKNGFEHYEISNFSLPKYRAVHNSSYWNNVEYSGFGPSAHSYFSNIRLWNTDRIKTYISKINNGEIFYETEEIDELKKYNEYLIKKLRTAEGLDFKEMEQFLGKSYLIELKQKITLINNKYFKINNNKFSLTLEGLFISDNIIRQLMKGEE